MTTTPVKAIAVFNSGRIQGTVRFTEMPSNRVAIDVDIKGLGENTMHGFHVHECGDMSDKCESMCAHFNPYKQNHGGPGSKERHVGDLGNVKADVNGSAKYRFYDNIIQLRGDKANIIGRGLIIHADQDDLGLGGQSDSLTTGHAGKRIACAVIGYAKP
jgi:Cu-Zn family superoxide dismutase